MNFSHFTAISLCRGISGPCKNFPFWPVNYPFLSHLSCILPVSLHLYLGLPLSSSQQLVWCFSGSFKEGLYRIWCGVNRLGDSGVNKLGDTSAFVNPVGQLLLTRRGKTRMHRRTGRGGSCPPNSGSLSTWIRAESRHYSGKTQYMFE